MFLFCWVRVRNSPQETVPDATGHVSAYKNAILISGHVNQRTPGRATTNRYAGYYSQERPKSKGQYLNYLYIYNKIYFYNIN